jgi:hypothetical protein
MRLSIHSRPEPLFSGGHLRKRESGDLMRFTMKYGTEEMTSRRPCGMILKSQRRRWI